MLSCSEVKACGGHHQVSFVTCQRGLDVVLGIYISGVFIRSVKVVHSKNVKRERFHLTANLSLFIACVCAKLS